MVIIVSEVAVAGVELYATAARSRCICPAKAIDTTTSHAAETDERWFFFLREPR